MLRQGAAARSGPPRRHALVVFALEMVLENVLSNHAPQPVSLFDGMTERMPPKIGALLTCSFRRTPSTHPWQPL
jgi:hypothetical protein